mgnify:CR=1 FL=1
MDVDFTYVFRELFREGEYLHASPFAGVGKAFKVHRVDFDAALGHHEAGDRTVDAAGEQQKPFAAGAYRHTADGALLPGAEIGREVADFHADAHIRMMDVHAQSAVGRFEDRAAYLGGDLGGDQREALVRTLGLHLEGFCAFEIRHKLIFRRFQNGFHRFFRLNGACDRGNAEGVFGCPIRAFHIGVLVFRLDVYRALERINAESAKCGLSLIHI